MSLTWMPGKEPEDDGPLVIVAAMGILLVAALLLRWLGGN